MARREKSAPSPPEQGQKGLGAQFARELGVTMGKVTGDLGSVRRVCALALPRGDEVPLAPRGAGIVAEKETESRRDRSWLTAPDPCDKSEAEEHDAQRRYVGPGSHRDILARRLSKQCLHNRSGITDLEKSTHIGCAAHMSHMREGLMIVTFGHRNSRSSAFMRPLPFPGSAGFSRVWPACTPDRDVAHGLASDR